MVTGVSISQLRSVSARGFFHDLARRPPTASVLRGSGSRAGFGVPHDRRVSLWLSGCESLWGRTLGTSRQLWRPRGGEAGQLTRGPDCLFFLSKGRESAKQMEKITRVLFFGVFKKQTKILSHGYCLVAHTWRAVRRGESWSGCVW